MTQQAAAGGQIEIKLEHRNTAGKLIETTILHPAGTEETIPAEQEGKQ